MLQTTLVNPLSIHHQAGGKQQGPGSEEEEMVEERGVLDAVEVGLDQHQPLILL
jgi:hypothetical protein